MRNGISHGECGKTWTGVTRAHCGACHETFNSDGGADIHRVGRFGVDRRCLPPASVGMVERDGVWYMPAPEGGHPFARSA